MFGFDSTIDAIQGAKKTFVNTFVQNTDLAKTLNDFVDAQSDYTKQAIKASTDTMTTVVRETTKATQNFTKIDPVQVMDKMVEAFTPSKK